MQKKKKKPSKKELDGDTDDDDNDEKENSNNNNKKKKIKAKYQKWQRDIGYEACKCHLRSLMFRSKIQKLKNYSFFFLYFFIVW